MNASTEAKQVLIVEPDAYWRLRHTSELARSQGYALARAFAGKREAQRFVTALHPPRIDCAVVNAVLPDGNAAELIREILAVNPEAAVLVLTHSKEETLVMQTISAGANGYVLLEEGKTSLVDCLRLLASGNSPVSPAVARCALRSLRCRIDLAREVPADCPLSVRQMGVLRLMASGIGFADMSAILSISLHTATTHAKAIYRRLGVHSRDEAVCTARQHGWLD